MKDLSEHWNRVYSECTDLPWATNTLPQDISGFVDLIPIHGRILDIGCGNGQHSLWLADIGYSVVGIDFSENAISLAKANAACQNLDLSFIVADVFDHSSLEGFDAALDYSVCHHVSDMHWANYPSCISRNLCENGKLLIVCYSDNDASADGGRIRVGKKGNAIYHRSREEIENLFGSFFDVLDYTETALGADSRHAAHKFLFQKRITEPTAIQD